MNPRFGCVFPYAALALVFSGCGPATHPAPVGKKEPVLVAAVEKGTAEKPRAVGIEVGDGMAFSVTRLEVASGEVIRLKLVNLGSAPKEAMGHNWVLLRGGADEAAFLKAALGAKATDYVPSSRAGDVIAHTKLIGGGGSDALVFTVPAAPGDYVYLCSFPAHCQLGMRGVLVVR